MQAVLIRNLKALVEDESELKKARTADTVRSLLQDAWCDVQTKVTWPGVLQFIAFGALDVQDAGTDSGMPGTVEACESDEPSITAQYAATWQGWPLLPSLVHSYGFSSVFLLVTLFATTAQFALVCADLCNRTYKRKDTKKRWNIVSMTENEEEVVFSAKSHFDDNGKLLDDAKIVIEMNCGRFEGLGDAADALGMPYLAKIYKRTSAVFGTFDRLASEDYHGAAVLAFTEQQEMALVMRGVLFKVVIEAVPSLYLSISLVALSKDLTGFGLIKTCGSMCLSLFTLFMKAVSCFKAWHSYGSRMALAIGFTLGLAFAALSLKFAMIFRCESKMFNLLSMACAAANQ